ncbi:MAG: HlyD family efflux transporter periplasmic adaptor subunit [Planctomycetaceae bacterium]|nr:HlyD family efflux transporter periplasmic adaptor subunit [Planctomycetaceae bacterium]
MKRLQYEIVRVVVPLLILAGGVIGFRVLGVKEVAHQEAPVKSAPLVETVAAVDSGGKFTMEVDGVSVPYRQVTLSAEIDGRITSKTAEARAGRYVTAGTPLLEIDPTNYQLEIDRLQAQLDQTDAELTSIKVQQANVKELIKLAEEDAKLQRQELERASRLFRTGAATETVLDTAKGKELTARKSWQTYLNEGLVLEEREKSDTAGRALFAAQLELARENLKRTRIVAPLTGTIVEDSVEADDFVRRGDPLVRISDSEHIEIKSSLTAEELYWVWMDAGVMTCDKPPSVTERYELPQTPVEVVFEFKGVEYTWNGKLSRYEGAGIDLQTRTVPCRIVVEQPTEVRSQSLVGGEPAALPALYTGMYLAIRIPIEVPLELVEIPINGLRPGNQVWVACDGVLTIREVQVVRTEDDRVLVLAEANGIQQGDQIVISPLSNVEDGMQVRESRITTPQPVIATMETRPVEETVAEAEVTPPARAGAER